MKAVANPKNSWRVKDSFKIIREYNRMIRIFIPEIAETNPVLPIAKADIIATMPATLVKPINKPQENVFNPDQLGRVSFSSPTIFLRLTNQLIAKRKLPKPNIEVNVANVSASRRVDCLPNKSLNEKNNAASNPHCAPCKLLIEISLE